MNTVYKPGMVISFFERFWVPCKKKDIKNDYTSKSMTSKTSHKEKDFSGGSITALFTDTDVPSGKRTFR